MELPKKNIKWYNQTFNEEWLKDPEFKKTIKMSVIVSVTTLH